MAFFARDTFTGTAGTALTSHTGDAPTNTTWATTGAYPGPWALTGGSPGGVIASSGANSMILASNTPPSADYPVSVDIFFPTVVSGDLVGVLARAQPTPDTHYFAFWSGGSWSLYSIVAGAGVQIGASSTTPAVTAGNTYTLTLACAGTTISMAVNGTVIVSGTDSSIAAAGQAGILTFPAGGVTPSASVNAVLRNFSAGLATANAITITAPVAYQTLQRNASNQATIAISGTYTGNPTTIEASWNGGAFVTIVASPTGGTYSGTLANQAAGQGTLTVRWSNDHSVTATKAFVGIGDVFVITGQSNAVGHGVNNQVYLARGLKATMFGYGYTWAELLDPTGDTTSAVDSPFVAGNNPAGGMGSTWVRLATEIMAYTKAPVAFLPCARDGAGLVSQIVPNPKWTPIPTDHQDRTTLYGATYYRVLQAGTVNGVKGILWWQGETDAYNSTSQAAYYAGLQALVAAFHADLGVPFLACKFQNSTDNLLTNNQAIWAAIGQGWTTITGSLPGPDISELDSDNGQHMTSDASLAVSASRWWDSILRGIYGGTGASGAKTPLGQSLVGVSL